jgi:hypothetical protein
MAEKTAVELALNSISWQLKRIADSLEELEDMKVNEQRAKHAPPKVNHPGSTLVEIQARLKAVKNGVRLNDFNQEIEVDDWLKGGK